MPTRGMQDLRQDDLGGLRPAHRSVKAGVPAGQWCGGTHTQAQIDAARATQGGGFFSKLLGR